MYKYKTNKQLYKLILNSNYATSTVIKQETISGNNVDVITKYFFKLNIQLPFIKNAKLAVRSFLSNRTSVIINNDNMPLEVGAIYSPTLNNRNIYTNDNKRGAHLLSQNLIDDDYITEYHNPNYDMNYIDIQNNISWLNDGIEIIVDSKIRNDGGFSIGGCSSNHNWVIELIIYEDEIEQNPDFTTDYKAVNLPLHPF